jgi:hypothetical protein
MTLSVGKVLVDGKVDTRRIKSTFPHSTTYFAKRGKYPWRAKEQVGCLVR